MASKEQDVDKSENSSSALFTTVDGEPMSFFLRPGPVKSKLQPLITSQGGVLCSVQKPGAILLIDPEERASIQDTNVQRYVSTKYIYDCIKKEERLNIEDYRLTPEVAPRQSPRLNNNSFSRSTRGRTVYTPEEEAAILSYVSKRKGETGGNRLWQTMARLGVTSHSWQSMKYHYKIQLAKGLPEAEKQNEETGEQEADVQKPPSEDAASAQTGSADSDLTQIDVQPEAAESTEPENAEAETSNPPQPGGACLDPQTDAEPAAAESTGPETAEQQETTSPQKESTAGDSVQSPPNTPAPEAATELKPPKRKYTRRKLEMTSSRNLRSSSTSVAILSSPSQPTKKTKSPGKPAVEKQATTEQPPPKKPREENMEPVAESQQEESEEAAVSETPQTEEEPKSLPEKVVEKKKQKRKLGILEMATREFEDESESAEDEAPDLQEATNTAAVQPTSTEPMSSDAAAEVQPTSTEPMSSDAAADPTPTASNPKPGPSPQGKAQQAQAPSSDRTEETGRPEPAASEAEQAASRAHLFIFDSESQEEESQTLLGDAAAARSRPQSPASNKDAAFSLTQVQLEEDMQRVKNLMNQTNQDLESVTKALLMTSGDFSAALDLLLNPFSTPRTWWSQRDDTLLLSANPVVLMRLQEKYGEEEVAKRIMFLEAER